MEAYLPSFIKRQYNWIYISCETSFNTVTATFQYFSRLRKRETGGKKVELGLQVDLTENRRKSTCNFYCDYCGAVLGLFLLV